ncbi:peptidase [Mycobacterium sp. ITM-2016-00317]|uniref:peptidase n=1 Tax=Mycobacterium sp. ITM-2016-00317 TaxID=2099694 RepID=UPI00287F6418|nr:peptidase [Mycobacterium sp. ITM-2016-00317]WNG86117.1 peptidase [Mycobacterium sp. ITM-2016-00317]
MGPSRSLRTTFAVAVAAGSLLVASGCSTTLQGEAVSIFDDPFRVAGMPATDGPTGLRPGAEGPARDPEGTDGGSIDELAASAVTDIEDYWATAYEETFDERFRPVAELISWDANEFDGTFCGTETFGLINAGYCYPERTLGWDRGELLPGLQSAYGDIGVVMVLAHEYGHAISRLAGLARNDTPTLVAEQQADCFAGAYMRWVAEDSSPRFTLSTGEGLNNVLAGVVSFRDPVQSEGDPDAGINEHGSAFERLSAFQFGFTDGPQACVAIDMDEIEQRRGELPVMLPEDGTGELPITESSVRAVVDAMGILFSPNNPPALSFDADSASNCPGVRASPPASYCPDTNTIVVDLPALEEMGAPADPRAAENLAAGDNVAYSVLVSRYMLALQRERGSLPLDDAETALRTACLTGVATVKMTEEVTTPDGETVALTAGDVDEAVSGILTNGLVASDVNGDSVPSGFSRIDAFRVGVLGDTERCFRRFA